MRLGSSTKTRAYTLGALLVAIPVLGACFWDENVKEPDLVIDSIQMRPASAVLKVGQSLNVVATPITLDGQPVFNKTYVWTSSDTSVVQAGAGGVILGKKVGSAIVTVTVDTFKGLTQVTVTP